MTTVVYFQWPCCKTKSWHYIDHADGPYPLKIMHTKQHKCGAIFNIYIIIDYNQSKTKLKATTTYKKCGEASTLDFPVRPYKRLIKRKCKYKCQLFKHCKRCSTCNCNVISNK